MSTTDGGWCLLHRRVGEEHLGGWAAAVAHDERLGSVTGTAEPLVVRLGPAVDDLDAVGDEVLPVLDPPLVAELGNGRHQEGQPGRRGGRVLHDEQVGVARVGEVGESAGRLEVVVCEPGDVVVDADVAEVDRGRLMLGDEAAQLVGDVVDASRLVRLEHSLVDDTREIRVVDAPHHVALRIAGGEYRLGDHRSRIAGDEQFDVDAGLVAEAVEGVVERGVLSGEGVVDDERDAGGFVRPRIGGDAEWGDRDGEQC